MASFQARGRDPLFDSKTQAVLERRGRELIGVALIVTGLLVALMLGTYVPEDPSWLAATDAPAHNMLGRFGASIASPLSIIVGLASWGFAVAFIGWGVRFVTHNGADRALGRVVFAPIAIAVLAVYASTHAPSEAYGQSYGGLFGDTVLAALLQILPGSTTFGFKVLSFVFFCASAGLSLFALGFTMPEIRTGGRFLLLGLVTLYVVALQAMGKGARGSLDLAAQIQARNAARRAEKIRIAAERAQAEEDRLFEEDYEGYSPEPAYQNPSRVQRAQSYAQPTYEDAQEDLYYTEAQEAYDAPAQPTGFLGKVFQRAAEPAAYPDLQPELVDRGFAPDVAYDAGSDDRITSKISDAVKSRVRGRVANGTTPLRGEPPMSAAQAAAMKYRKGPKPVVLSKDPVRRIEPRVSAPVAPVMVESAQEDFAAGYEAAPFEVPHDTPPQAAPFDGPAFAPAVAPLASVPPAGVARESAAPVISGPQISPRVARGGGLEAQMGREFVPHSESMEDEDFGYSDEPDYRNYEPDYESGYASAFGADDSAQREVSHGFADPMEELDAIDPLDEPDYIQPSPYRPAPTPEPKKVVQHGLKRAVMPSKQARAEAQPVLRFDAQEAQYEHPPLSLLANPEEITRHVLSDEALEENARMLESVLDDYGVKGEIVSVRPGPVVTMYELEPAPGLKASRVIGLSDDIARSMSALSARVSTVPGRSVIGIELPNANREKVVLREILSARDFGDSNMKLPLALGKDIGGDPVVANLAKMPHLLIAGTTGSGKSVAINTMILSLLYKLTPEECRLIMIDPKMLELSVYDGIPHLLSPVVTDPKKAVVALKWVVGEMEERYRKMSKMGVRNIDGYNSRVADTLGKGEMFSRTVQTGFDEDTGEPIFETEEFAPEKLPYIVVIVDEMADLMMVAGKEIEACIQRLAQMARASGIHLIMATQRPSVDVITGTIKANFPTRISFQVTSKIDSRTILGEMGAEQLLGMGDMLYMAGGSRIGRVHGPFVSDEEVEEIVTYLKSYGPPDYIGGVVEGPDEGRESDIDAVLGLSSGGNTDMEDALYDTAVAIVIKDRKCSTSYIQRKLAIGYNKAARLVEQMEDQGVVSAANHVGKREILVPEQ
ncbi:DNA translocase FtsK [Aquimixticola soesokkakensis]|uniref:DNA translocase FtsK n=1 Tax=Aquimixticola soesokkakensis TaxID=1519096 RepID=A0A1Y5TUT5_9RHOB|nr:DNA translocase FtsK [Aquimixticola soesokkakensis]SLN68525.1 DNA translocase FtsK [Aquimixticola soesokkakensis]